MDCAGIDGLSAFFFFAMIIIGACGGIAWVIMKLRGYHD